MTSLRLRDLRSGERITLTNTSPDSETRRGDLMLGRPLPIGDTWRAYSGLVKVVALDAPSSRKVRRLGFLSKQVKVPDDFDRMGKNEIDHLINSDRRSL